MPNLTILIQYAEVVLAIIMYLLFWRKFSVFACLIVGLTNAIYGFEIFASLTPDTPGLTIMFTVGSILTIFGIWGLVLWTRQTANHYKDQTPNTDSIEEWWRTVRAFDIILIIGLALRLFIIQPFIVEGPSMEPNFTNSEAILVDKVTYKLRPPIRGEVVVFVAPQSPQDDYIKRMIGLPGDTVTVDHGKVYVNNIQINESFLSASGQTPVNSEKLQVTVGPNEYFVLGDNRPHSSDSRDWGFVPKSDMIGRAVASVWPYNMIGLIKTPNLGL